MRSAPARALRALPTLLRIGVAETVAYRAEFLVWMLTSTMPFVNLALWSVAREAVASVGQDLITLLEQEEGVATLDLDAIFDYGYYIRHVPEILERLPA